jgi:predicted membrane metal-binding protein
MLYLYFYCLGLILTVLGAFFWILFSVVFGIVFMFAGEIPLPYMALIYISGLAMLFSLPITAIIEIYHW